MENNELIVRYSPFLNEIRKRVTYTLITFAAAAILGFVYYEQIIKLLINILSLNGVNIVFTSPFQFINLAISCGIAAGLIFVFPLIIYQVLAFLRPALKKKEYRMILGLLPFSIVLFFAGFSFGILVMKWQIQLFLTKSVSLGIGNILDISRLMSTVILVSVLMGVAFQFPVVIILLTRLGIIKHSQLAKQRLWLYLGALLFTFLLPLDSLLADALLTIPIVILFEVTLIWHRIFGKSKTAVA